MPRSPDGVKCSECSSDVDYVGTDNFFCKQCGRPTWQRKRFLVIPIPKENYSRELLRVFSNDIHGEFVVTVSSEGKLEISIYQPEKDRAVNGDLREKSYLIPHEGTVLSKELRRKEWSDSEFLNDVNDAQKLENYNIELKNALSARITLLNEAEAKIAEANKIVEDDEVWNYNETDARQRLRLCLADKTMEDKKRE